LIDELTVAIIGGGKSKRFGEHKSFAIFNRKRLVDYAMELANSISEKVIMISPNHIDYSGIDIRVYEDVYKNCGPIGGLYTALHYAKTTWVLTIPVDMPLLIKPIYDILWERKKENAPIIAYNGNDLEPLVAIWPVSALTKIKEFIEINKYSLRNPISALDSVIVNVPKVIPQYRSDFFHNINYKKDMLLERPSAE
jgi:molybdopterin-guanine dinucleotide biosynthesis protein A